jgi:hypothetical protein
MTRRRKALGVRGASAGLVGVAGGDARDAEGAAVSVGHVLVQETQDVVQETQDIDILPGSQMSKTPPTPTLTANKDKRRQNIKSYIFTDQQEVDLADWYRDNPILYNRRDKNYKRTTMKDTLYEEKCKTFQPPCTGECYSKSITKF